MGKIQVLDEHIANQIAAGEVVERPASVIKELIENSIDAGATKIEVSVEEGGLDSIRITDNGSGIDPEDCETAFYRHATSKLSSSRDLYQIRTLGFRGEALPSIAAVAKVKLLTANSDSGLGREVVIEGGNLKSSEDAPAPQGTDITVKELFYNTPARLKYMKTIQTELGHISDVVYRQALAHPEIGFVLRHNGNLLLQTQGNGDLLQVIASIYGNNAARSMLSISAEDPDYRITGYIGRPELTRSNRAGMSTIVNGRFIRNPALQQAILRAYHTLLPIGRYPLLVLELKMHPSLVDVNVHPAKLEVRFSKEAELTAFVEAAIKETLSQEVLIPQVVKQKISRGSSNSVIQEQFHFSAPSAAPFGDSASEAGRTRPGQAGIDGAAEPDRPGSGSAGEPFPGGQGTPPESEAAPDLTGEAAQAGLAPPGDKGYAGNAQSASLNEQVREQAAAAQAYPYPDYAQLDGYGNPDSAYRSQQPAGQSAVRPAGGTVQNRSGGGAKPSASGSVNRNPAVPAAAGRLYESPAEQAGLPAFPELTYIGQHHGTYLIANNDTGLYLIDQHAAHERVNYEYFYEKFGAPADASQELLLPITIEFTPSESAKLKERLHWFEQVGVVLEHFGGQTFRVVSLPYWFPQGEEAALVEEMAEWVLNERTIDLAKLREKSSILVSCKASIKANQKLTEDEANTLLKRLAACRQPYTCPHGRPIVVSFTSYDLEKLFKRVM
ncbi:DNA mismatch repair protein MutL [Paenibacillus yonginensis]|uniref:DNA mismatch repair protein MutL n=1 Tax=Paenibacillus yonginensis TaxID=1462996 RepID=A0A1B1N6V8_9BACL|nr:DNA mismatch repair endonuclease MutL [Paenibacillus yonginensis]ANS77159.1 DNA mismatch repair protein MutL [Paenibacillus yonginensis]